MTALTAVTSQLSLPLDDRPPFEAQLAAAAFLGPLPGTHPRGLPP